MRRAFEYQIPDGPRVVLAEMPVSEVLLAMKAAGAKAGPFTIRAESLRHSLREVDGHKVSFIDLAGDRLDKRIPRSRHQFALGQAWAKLHEPAQEEVEAVKASLSCAQDLQGERWGVTLPDGRRVVLAELRPATVDQALQRARTAGRNEALQQLVTVVESLRMAIVEIDGRAVSSAELDGEGWDERFSAKETLLLGVAWQEAFSMPELDAMGEMKPVSGTP
jgi:hypothetical protein